MPRAKPQLSQLSILMSLPADSSTSVGTDGEGYGPIRRKVLGKQGPLSLFRPGSMAQDDFADMMQEVVPQLIEQVLQQEDQSMSVAERSSSVKRDVSPAGH